MTGRERFLTAMNNGKADRLPCQVHSWLDYYLKTYLNGMDQYQAYDFFNMDKVIYVGPTMQYEEKDLANWQKDFRELGQDDTGNHLWTERITTPDGDLTSKGAWNQFTGWRTEYIIKSEADFEIWNKYYPKPSKVDWTPVIQAKDRIGDQGIVRGGFYDFGQGAPWQSFCTLYGTEPAILAAMDNPEWIHYVLKSLVDRKIEAIEKGGKMALDLIETGGGAASSTVISPSFHREFCLPYDKMQHKAIHEIGGAKIVYHLCGGLMPMLDIVVENGADGLETMTPPAMGGDCDLAEATRRVGDKLFFIGGFDQSKGFEKGNPAVVREMVKQLHAACPDGGYICSPSDHFFFGDPENVRAFAETAKECLYD
jgi:hypothetical protein